MISKKIIIFFLISSLFPLYGKPRKTKKIRNNTVLIISPRLQKNYKKIKLLIKSVHRAGDYRIKLMHFLEVTPQKVDKINPIAIIISGNNTPWHFYQNSSLNPLKILIKRGKYPILGICGGHQLIGLSYGVPTGYVYSPKPVTTYKRCKRVKGRTKTYFLKRDPINVGLPEMMRFYAFHCEDLKRLPAQFELLAATPASPIYMIRHKERLIYGVQFHPEKTRAGIKLLRNFLKIARLKNRGVRPQERLLHQTLEKNY